MFETKKQLRWSALKSGLLFTLALLIVFAVVIYAGSIRQLFTSSFAIKAQFQDVKGLMKGAPIWLFGTEVGYVRDIEMNPVYGIVVTLSIKKSAEPYIKANSEAEILTMGLLGDKYVELSPGLPEAGPIGPGEMIKGKAPTGLTQVVEASTKTIEKMGELTNKVNSLISSITEGQGTLAKFINDPTLYNSLEKSSTTFHSLLEEIEKSQGTLRLLLEEPSLYRRLEATASSLEEWSKNLQKRSGTLKKLIENPELYENLNKSAGNLNSILAGINRGQGMAGAFVRDDKLVAEVKESLTKIQGLTEEITLLLKEIKEHPEKYFKFSLF